MSEWRDISTAPKDGTVILLGCEAWRIADMGAFLLGPEVPEGAWYPWTLNRAFYPQPTHWMELPNPPAQPSSVPGEPKEKA